MEGLLTYWATPIMGPLLSRAGIKGKDMHKKKRPELPEALGLVAGMILLYFIPNNRIFWCTLVGLWIGALDDTVDIAWRYKMLLSALAYVPIYSNVTTVILFGHFVVLGPLYHVYMITWCMWCGNAINIHAGINGIEVGQCLVIALGLLFVVQDTRILLSYILVCMGLLPYNWYPASVFVGDSWCYMSGMFFVAIAQHETETLALMMLPQIVNTVLSLPELSGYCECPRHRMPKHDVEHDILVSSGRGTLMNTILNNFGPLKENKLCIYLIIAQAWSVCVALFVKYILLKF